jgi:hypothetical protein
MKCYLTLGMVLIAACNSGCVTLQPIGPFAEQLGGAPAPHQPSNAVRVTDQPDRAVHLPPAPPPVPPAILVSPGDVGEMTPQQAADKLREEMNADRKALERMPRYAEVSRLPRK